MSVSVHRRPAAVLAVATLLTAGLAAPASASPWSDAWSRLSGWFASEPLGAFWAAKGMLIDPSGRPDGAPRQIVGQEGALVDPSGRPAQIITGEGTGIDPNEAPQH